MAKYIKKPIVVEAVQYYRGIEDGIDTIVDAQASGLDIKNYVSPLSSNEVPYINTLEGKHYISKGDFIITGTDNERYPCKESIFNKIYTLVE